MTRISQSLGRGTLFLGVAWQKLIEMTLGGTYLGQQFSFSRLHYAITPSDKLFTVVSLTYLDANENQLT